VRAKQIARKASDDNEQYRLFKGRTEPIYCVAGRSSQMWTVAEEAGNPSAAKPQIYIASKVVHAPKWRDLRDEGWPVISTWIDEAGEGESKCLSDLTIRCIAEAVSCTHFLLYCEEREILKGALLECGAALAHDVPVFCVGSGPSISRVFEHHPRWHRCETVEEALLAITGQMFGRSAPASFDASFSMAGSTDLVASKTYTGKPS
jgi:hypothetical protein